MGEHGLKLQDSPIGRRCRARKVYQIDSLRPGTVGLILTRRTGCDFSAGLSDEKTCITAACRASGEGKAGREGARSVQ